MKYPEYAKVGSALYAVSQINNWLDSKSGNLNISNDEATKLKKLLKDLAAGLAVLKKYAE